VVLDGAAAPAPPSPLLAITAHPSMANVPVTLLLCGFNVRINGLKQQQVRHSTLDFDGFLSFANKRVKAVKPCDSLTSRTQ